MSIIYTPTGISIPSQMSDGLENLLTKGSGLSTNSLVFATISQIEILPNLFNNERNNARVEVNWIGRIIGAAGNKQLRFLFDAITVFTTPGFVTSFTEHCCKSTAVFRNNQILVHARAVVTPTATGQSQDYGGLLPFTVIDPTISHTLSLQALVANAADSVTVEWVGSSLI